VVLVPGRTCPPVGGLVSVDWLTRQQASGADGRQSAGRVPAHWRFPRFDGTFFIDKRRRTFAFAIIIIYTVQTVIRLIGKDVPTVSIILDETGILR
jgi:hypothetical protein